MLGFELKALSDQIAQIREDAIKNLSALVQLFGEEWFTEMIMPTINEAARRMGPAGYLGRITACSAVGQLCTVLSPGLLVDNLIPQILVPLVKDKVVNVRIAAAEALVSCGVKLGDTDGDGAIGRALSQLRSDTDNDVIVAVGRR